MLLLSLCIWQNKGLSTQVKEVVSGRSAPSSRICAGSSKRTLWLCWVASRRPSGIAGICLVLISCTPGCLAGLPSSVGGTTGNLAVHTRRPSWHLPLTHLLRHWLSLPSACWIHPLLSSSPLPPCPSHPHLFLLPGSSWCPRIFSAPTSTGVIFSALESNYMPIHQKLFHGLCGRLKIGPPKDIHILIAGTSKCYLIKQKKVPCRCDWVKHLEMGRLSWVIWVAPKCNHVSRKREAEEVFAHTEDKVI